MDTRGAHDLGDFSALSEEEREALIETARSTETKPVVTAFLVVVNDRGGAMAHADPSVLEEYDAQPASLEQIQNACNFISADIIATRAASLTVNTIQQHSAAMAEAARNQAAWSKAQAGGKR